VTTDPAALCITGATLDGRPVGLRCEGGVIAALGPDVAPLAGDDVLDGRGTAVLGGFVNAHTHAAMTLLRGYGSDLQLQEWLEHRIWPAEARLTADDVYWGTRLAALEMLRSGTVHFVDMYWHPEAVARAAQDAGIRATVGAPLFDGGNAEGLAGVRDAALASVEALAGAGPLVRPSVTPHAPYTVSEPSLAWVAEFAAEHDLVVHIHFAETLREMQDWADGHDESLTAFADRIGLLGPRTVLAHACVLEPEDYERIAERGSTVVTNPVSNMKLANGKVFPYPTVRDAGAPVGLGTDGPASNNSLDLLADTKVFTLLQKHAAYDPTVLPAAEALAIAQGRRSALLGGRPVEVGEPADLVLVRTDVPEMQPGDVVDNVVYAASGSVVDSTIVAGVVRMRHRAIDGADDVIAEVTERRARIVRDDD
jgi:5-methylthioadenosine/S-adenosylhomocysteine deaminase